MLASGLQALLFPRTSRVKPGLPRAQAGASNLYLERPLLATPGHAPLLRSPTPAPHTRPFSPSTAPPCSPMTLTAPGAQVGPCVHSPASRPKDTKRLSAADLYIDPAHPSVLHRNLEIPAPGRIWPRIWPKALLPTPSSGGSIKPLAPKSILLPSLPQPRL